MVNRIETIRVIKEVRSWKNFSGHCGQQRPKPNSPSLGKGWPEAGVGGTRRGRQTAVGQKEF